MSSGSLHSSGQRRLSPSHSFGRIGVLVFAAVVQLSARPAKGTEAVARAAAPGVARIVAGSAVGTGFLVRADGALVTAYHVVAGQEAVWAHFPSGKACRAEGLLVARPDLDIAVLKLPAAGLPQPPPLIAMGEGRDLNAGAPITAIGYPDGTKATVVHGALLRRPNLQGPRMHHFQLAALARSGCSGGPMLTADGKAVGVMVSSLETVELAFASALAQLGPLPEPGAPVESLEAASRRHEGSAEDVYGRGLAVLQFWESQEADGPEMRPAVEWALTQFREAIRRRPDFAEGHFNVALCLQKLGRGAEAVAALQRAARLAGDNLAIRMLLSYVHAAQGRVKDAVVEARAAVQLAPLFAPSRRLLGAYYSTSGEYAAAASEFKAALEIRPKDAKTLMALGDVLMLARRHEEALLSYRRLTELELENADARRALGGVYAVLKRHGEAALAFKSALKLKPDLAPARHGLALACLALGDRQQALREYEALRELDAGLAGDLRRRLGTR